MRNSKKILPILCTILVLNINLQSEESKIMAKEIISTENAPQAIGPYSQAVKTGNLIFISGQIPLDPKTLNISPLKDFKCVIFIKNTHDLENAIIKFSSQNNYSVEQRCIFNLSSDLQDWQNLLYENNSFH